MRYRGTSIETRELGRTGLRVSRIGLGGFPFGGLNRAAGWDPFTPEGRQTAIGTIRRALERGITYIDTAPSYGDGNSERIVGEALQGRRDAVTLASKCSWAVDGPAVTRSIEASLERLRTDRIDVIQFHGGMFTAEDVAHIVHGGPLEALRRAREQGKVRFIGFTCEEPWTARPLIAAGVFDVVQLRYNLIYQGAALHVLNEARVDVLNVGMRWPHEVDRNVEVAESFRPPMDMAELPRLTAGIYRAEDEAATVRGSA